MLGLARANGLSAGGSPGAAIGRSAEMADVAAALLARLEALEATKFDPPRGKPDAKSCDALWDNGGYWGPWLK